MNKLDLMKALREADTDTVYLEDSRGYTEIASALTERFNGKDVLILSVGNVVEEDEDDEEGDEEGDEETP